LPTENLLLDFERWGFDRRAYAKKTRENYVTQARKADRFLRENQHTPLTRATTRDLLRYSSTLSPHPATRNRTRQALVAFFDFLVDERMRDDNPAQGLPRLKERRPLPKALEPETAALVLKAAKAHGPRWQAFFGLLFHEGLRRDEARLLEWHQVEGSFVRFVAKGGQERMMPLHDDAVSALIRWRQSCPCPRWVFPSPRFPMQPMSASYVAQQVRAIGESVGVDNLHPHIGRHSFATALLERGADIAVVQEALGHREMSSTAIYVRARPQRVADAVRQLTF
jgi:integrase/recombinase XerD